MRNRIAVLPGTPRRIRLAVPWNVEDKVDLPPGDLASVIPLRVRIEVTSGRNSTRSALRAARVQHALEEVGATAETVELDEEHATLTAEANRRQVFHVAHSPFVKRVTAN